MLVRLVDVNAGPPIDRLVWVNMIDLTAAPDPFFGFPSGNYIPQGSPSEPERATPEPRPPHSYYLIFVDAKTGEYLYAYAD